MANEKQYLDKEGFDALVDNIDKKYLSKTNAEETYATKEEVVEVKENDFSIKEMYIEDNGEVIDIYTKEQIDEKLSNIGNVENAAKVFVLEANLQLYNYMPKTELLTSQEEIDTIINSIVEDGKVKTDSILVLKTSFYNFLPINISYGSIGPNKGLTIYYIIPFGSKQKLISINLLPTGSIIESSIAIYNLDYVENCYIEHVGGSGVFQCELNKLHSFKNVVNELSIVLPIVEDTTKVQETTVCFTTGDSPQVTIECEGANVRYFKGFVIEPNTTYELSAMWNGKEWVIASKEVE